MAVRKKEDEVHPSAAGIDVGGSSHWVAVPARSCEESVREFGAMTDDLNAIFGANADLSHMPTGE